MLKVIKKHVILINIDENFVVLVTMLWNKENNYGYKYVNSNFLNKDDILYHYTSGNGILGIFNEKYNFTRI